MLDILRNNIAIIDNIIPRMGAPLVQDDVLLSIRLSKKTGSQSQGRKLIMWPCWKSEINPKLVQNFPRFEKNQIFFFQEIFVISLLILSLFKIIKIGIVISDYFGNFGFFGKSQVLCLLSCDWLPVFFRLVTLYGSNMNLDTTTFLLYGKMRNPLPIVSST